MRKAILTVSVREWAAILLLLEEFSSRDGWEGSSLVNDWCIVNLLVHTDGLVYNSRLEGLTLNDRLDYFQSIGDPTCAGGETYRSRGYGGARAGSRADQGVLVTSRRQAGSACSGGLCAARAASAGARGASPPCVRE